ncbi:MAG: hypothetical protein MJ145_02800 [Clostridia bacterium]|nr:hypothetical protein [Clostridia bacterium]
MSQASNRRLCNVKTRSETGLEYVISKLNILTPYGKKEMAELRPYFPGEEAELREQLDKSQIMLDFCKSHEDKLNSILRIFMEMKDLSNTIECAKKTTLAVVELYDYKVLLLQMRNIINACNDLEEKLPDEYLLADVEDVIDILDPRHDRMATFYLYNEFSEKLAQLRDRKHALELEARKAQKSKRDELRKTLGIQLTPKFDITVSKQSTDYDKVKTCDDLELVDEDYVSVTYKLKSTPQVYEIMKEIGEVDGEIDLEEERVCAELSHKLGLYSELVAENCKKIGKLDLVIAKAQYYIKHDMVKPDICDEHILDIVDGRNLVVVDHLEAKGKKYTPVSIHLEDGVTCITGANMGGKTISLKLAGMIKVLAQYGFFVPAAQAKVGLSNFIQMLIGDSQAVERGLSTFGSEMEELKEILDHGRDRSMILIDEIASGTNPVEGLALTRSLIDYLKVKPYITLITTHFDAAVDPDVVNMQVKGLSDVNFTSLNTEISRANRKERIDIISRHMDYRLYRVENQGQVPKDALNIAMMLGINSEIIEGAKKYIK